MMDLPATGIKPRRYQWVGTTGPEQCNGEAFISADVRFELPSAERPKV
jgi:hypothetical protein